MKAYLAIQYLAAQCNFAHQSPTPFLAVHRVTVGRVCDTGCAEFNDGKCVAYKALVATATGQPVRVDAGETVRQEAQRRGLSISEIRRQRRA